jgi:hypothetical protein
VRLAGAVAKTTSGPVASTCSCHGAGAVDEVLAAGCSSQSSWPVAVPPVGVRTRAVSTSSRPSPFMSRSSTMWWKNPAAGAVSATMGMMTTVTLDVVVHGSHLNLMKMSQTKNE